jgi:putative membrane protein
MIVRPQYHWFRRLFIWHGSVLPHILLRLCLNLLMALLAVSCTRWYGQWGIRLTLAPFSVLGVAIAIALGFRNNASYARFAEARLLWGQLLITQRSLLRQVKSMLPQRQRDSEYCAALQIGFCHALKHQLRQSDPRADLARVLPAGVLAQLRQHPAPGNRLLLLLGQWFGQLRSRQQLSDILFQALDGNLNQLSSILGGCERIANTPIPLAYTLILHRSVYLFCTLLPFALVSELHYMTLLVSVFVSYTLISLEYLAEELEDPFGSRENNLPLHALCNAIEISLLEMNDARWLPGRHQADHRYRLM